MRRETEAERAARLLAEGERLRRAAAADAERLAAEGERQQREAAERARRFAAEAERRRAGSPPWVLPDAAVSMPPPAPPATGWTRLPPPNIGDVDDGWIESGQRAWRDEQARAWRAREHERALREPGYQPLPVPPAYLPPPRRRPRRDPKSRRGRYSDMFNMQGVATRMRLEAAVAWLRKKLQEAPAAQGTGSGADRAAEEIFTRLREAAARERERREREARERASRLAVGNDAIDLEAAVDRVRFTNPAPGDALGEQLLTWLLRQPFGPPENRSPVGVPPLQEYARRNPVFRFANRAAWELSGVGAEDAAVEEEENRLLDLPLLRGQGVGGGAGQAGAPRVTHPERRAAGPRTAPPGRGFVRPPRLRGPLSDKQRRYLHWRMATEGKMVEVGAAAGSESGRLWIGLELDPLVAQMLAIPGGEPAEKLHVTLWIGEEGSGAQATPAVWETLALVAACSEPLVGRVGGVGRFLPSEGSDGRTVLYAVPDVVGISELHGLITAALEECGLAAARDHGYNPHCTLGYFPEDAVPEVTPDPWPLGFAELVVRTGPEDPGARFPLCGLCPQCDAALLAGVGDPAAESAPCGCGAGACGCAGKSADLDAEGEAWLRQQLARCAEAGTC